MLLLEHSKSKGYQGQLNRYDEKPSRYADIDNRVEQITIADAIQQLHPQFLSIPTRNTRGSSRIQGSM